MTVLMTMVGAVGIGGIIGALKLFVSEQMERVETRMNSITTDIEGYVDNKALLFKEDLVNRISAPVSKEWSLAK
ncbi:MAG TPA: hypothetical protein DHW22_14045 [Planctomycetaceae bacterium]|nr:hypothetical protein [Planctomycetaceae bacterium]